MIDALLWRCSCERTYTTQEVMALYVSGGCICGDNGSYERIGQGEVHPILCAWCDKVLRYGPAENSHGICGPCQREHFPATVKT